MDTKLEKLPKSQVKLQVTLSDKEFKPFRERAFLRLSSQTDIKGFRPGKAPKDLIEERIGKDKIFQEALEICLPQTYFQALKKEKIQPVADPEIKIEKYDGGKPLQFTAIIDILPEFKLPDYKKVKVKKKAVKVTPKQIEDSLRQLQKSYANYKEKKEKAAKGDKIEIDFEGYHKGAKIEQLTSRSHPLILGEGGFVPGFEDKLIGLKKDEEKEFEMTLPKDLRDKFLAGQKVKFKVKILGVWSVELPKLDDEFAQKIAKGKKFAQLKEEISSSLQKRLEQEEGRRIETEILNKLTDQIQMEIPQSLVKNEQSRMFFDLQRDIENRGLAFAQYLESIGKSEKELMDALGQQAEKSVKIGIMMAEIKKAEKVKVSEAEILKELEMLKGAGYNIEDVGKAKHQIEHNLENRKTLTKLVDYATK